MQPIAVCENVSKVYGKKTALDALTFSVLPGQIVGLLGPNGAGKTTLMKLLVSLLRDHTGEIRILGEKPGTKTKQHIAYLPDREFLYLWMSVADTLAFFRRSFADFELTRAERLIAELGLNPKDKVRALSKGMQERLGVALTFSRRAKLYILDEPLAAVDPSTRSRIMEMILSNFDPDSAILISTHLVREVESLFTHVAIIDEGKLRLHGSIQELTEGSEQSIEELFRALV